MHPIDPMRNKMFLEKLPIEAICWLGALIALYFSDPYKHHFTLCPLTNVGLQWCPGCGLGRSITLFMHGDFEASWGMHWLGIPAFLVIVHRIYSLLKRTYYSWINRYHE